MNQWKNKLLEKQR